MLKESHKHPVAQADLRQHFHNYFELLLGAERGKLQQAILIAGVSLAREDVLVEIDCRINYLRGSVRMGKLLCLIDQEEEKNSLCRLSSERDRLRNSALASNEKSLQVSEPYSSAEHIARVRRSFQK
jgi:hypothetical protein